MPSSDLPTADTTGISPAGVDTGGGGGAAGGGGGGTPLSAASPAGVAPASTAGTPTVATPQGGTGSSGAGGGMGGMPMGGHGQQGKEKRRAPGLSPDEVIYEEDREWTEGVIGNRRRAGQEGKEPK